jgi:uncharacterized protein
VLGFAISAIVQAWVPRERIEALMSGSDARSIGWATGLGAASSSCSYAAIAIAKSLFQKGANAAAALAFQFASTNLVWELGLRQPRPRAAGPRARPRGRHRPSASHGRRAALLA